MPMSRDEQIESQAEYDRAMEKVGPLIALMEANGMAPTEIATIGSLIVAYCFQNALPGQERKFLQVNLDIVQRSGVVVHERVGMAYDEAGRDMTDDQLFDRFFLAVAEDDR
jgi:hypothetical protein